MKVGMHARPGEIEAVEMSTPAIGEGEALIKVGASGVCATDVKIVQRGHPYWKPPVVLGHEAVGTVVEVRGEIGRRVGERVVIAPYVGCGRCYYCRKGEETMCVDLLHAHPDPGGFAEYVRIPAPLARAGLLPIPDGLSMQLATLAEPLSCVIRAARSTGVKPGDVVLVIGDGPLGMMNAAVARAYGAGTVIVSGLSSQRLAVARENYADVTVDAGRQNLEEVVRGLTEGCGADAVIVAVASPEVVRQGVRLARKGGAVNIFAGQPAGSLIDLDAAEIHYSELKITGNFGSSPRTMHEALELATHRLNLAPIVTAEFPIDEIAEAIRYSAEWRGLRAVIRMV